MFRNNAGAITARPTHFSCALQFKTLKSPLLCGSSRLFCAFEAPQGNLPSVCAFFKDSCTTPSARDVFVCAVQAQTQVTLHLEVAKRYRKWHEKVRCVLPLHI